LIKNVSSDENKKKTNNCLFYEKLTKRVFATDCNILLSIKSKNLDKYISLNQFQFFWLNQSQIKTKNEKCLHPIETSIIKNNKISYHGFIDVRDCILNTNKVNDSNNIFDKNNENFNQIWKINENNRIINEFNKKCLVISKEFSNIFKIFEKKEKNIFNDNNYVLQNLRVENNKNNIDLKKKEKNIDFKNFDKVLRNELKEYKLYDVYLADCLGNTQGYDGRENFILEEYKTEKLEMMALNKLINVYKKGNDNIDSFINKSSEYMLKLIKFNSKLIENRELLDKIEYKLEESQLNVDKLSDDEKESLYEKDGILKKSDLNFQIYGLLHEKIEIKSKNMNFLNL